MNKIRRIIMWTAMVFIMLLFIFSVYGAFLGAERAKQFFNSIPLAVYWIAFILLLAAGTVLFKRLLNKPTLMLMHTGCIFILAGGLWGSESGHNIRNKFLDTDKIPNGMMRIYEGTSSNLVETEDGRQKELPFHVRLEDFRIEYYPPDQLYIQTKNGRLWIFPALIETEFPLGPEYGKARIVREFKNFRMQSEDNTIVALDEPDSGSNPALEVELTNPSGQEFTRYVFGPSLPYMYPDDGIYMFYYGGISDYISRLQILSVSETDNQRQTQVLAQKDIQVNYPLHYGGYHFYQQDFDHEQEQYTVLQVVSDSGLIAVYAGYIMLCAGICYHFWFRKYSGNQSTTAMDGTNNK